MTIKQPLHTLFQNARVLRSSPRKLHEDKQHEDVNCIATHAYRLHSPAKLTLEASRDLHAAQQQNRTEQRILFKIALSDGV